VSESSVWPSGLKAVMRPVLISALLIPSVIVLQHCCNAMVETAAPVRCPAHAFCFQEVDAELWLPPPATWCAAAAGSQSRIR
jgi:hypothetical protein